MRNVCFVYSWQNETDQSWSGTPKGICNAMEKQATVRKLNVSTFENGGLAGKLREVLCPAAGYKHAKKILNADGASHDAPYIVFGEYDSDIASRTYCYQDLSIDFMIRELRDKHSHYAALPAAARAIALYTYSRKVKRAAAFYRHCAGVFTMSEWLRQDLIRNTGLPAEKVHHVGGGCSVDVSRVDWSQKTGNKFLFVGKDWTRKNGELVVAAFKKMAAAHPDRKPQLYVAGPTEAPACIADCENIHFLGRLTYDELVGHYNLCDYFVMPSAFEAYGLVFIEALAFGLPCIGMNRYAMPEFIRHGENGFLIEQDDTDELASVMTQMLCDGEEITRRVQDQHTQIVETYSWDSVAARMLAVMSAK